jgi:beta-lactamase class A
VSAGVYDVNSAKTYLYRPNTPTRTASMAKIEILATLLYQAQREHRALTNEERYLATEMIEYSDNAAAETLYEEVGQISALTAFSHLVGANQTTFYWDWGSTETTPHDELQVLKTIVLPNKVLSNASRAYEMYLMEHVASYERFGVGQSVPAAALVGLKNGWRPDGNYGWEVNTAGFVKYRGRFYLCVVMSDYNSEETYGINTDTTVAQDVYRYLKP